jgi:hypothetical protein
MDHSALSNISQDDFEHQMEQAVCEIEPSLRGSAPAADQVVATAQPDAVAQPVGSSLFDRPLEAIRGAFSDLSLRRGQDPPHLVTGVPTTRAATAPVPSPTSPTPVSPRRRRGYTPSLYSRSSESLVPTVTTPAAGSDDERARRGHQADLGTLQACVPARPFLAALICRAQDVPLDRARCPRRRAPLSERRHQ